MSELVVENGKIFEKQELSTDVVADEIARLAIVIADLQAQKTALEAKQAEAAE